MNATRVIHTAALAGLVLLAPLPGAQAQPATKAGAPSPAAFALRDGDRVVFYGDSITQAGGYGQLVEAYVVTRFPSWQVSFENAGVGGDTVRGGWAGPVDVRLERDVVARKPTVVTVMLGMNDGGYKPFDPTTLAAFSDGYAAIVRRLEQALPGVRLTLVRSSPFDDVARPPQFAPGYDDALRRLGCLVAALGAREKATVVDFRTPVNEGVAAVLRSDPELARLLLPDRVHPSAAGHLLMGATLLRAWGASATVTRVSIDAAARSVSSAENTTLSGLGATEAGGLRWTQLDRALPLPVSFDDADVELAQKAGADLASLDTQPLAVSGLSAGRYQLKIDGQAIGTFAEGDLARGIDLARFNTPQRWQAYSVRWSVEDSLQLQLLRRRLMASAGAAPEARAAIAFLDAQDDAARQARRESATPRPHAYELARLK
jgi:lysophospholipase L1-like esterase